LGINGKNTIIKKVNLKMKKNRLESKYGFIDYSYEINEKYPNGILLFMGSYINKSSRGQGKFKEMVKELFSKFPMNTLIQVATINKHLISFFDRLGFKIVDTIEHWGNASNAIKLERILDKNLINKI
jgi:hypothetical protein